MENSLMTWLFNFAPVTALALFLAWAIWRLGTLSGKYETRFAHIEADVSELKTDMKQVKDDIAKLDARLGKLEGQMEMVISLLQDLTTQVHELARQRNP